MIGSRQAGAASNEDCGSSDELLDRLSSEERAKLSMDAWEPSLLRRLLGAQNKPEHGSDDPDN